MDEDAFSRWLHRVVYSSEGDPLIAKEIDAFLKDSHSYRVALRWLESSRYPNPYVQFVFMCLANLQELSEDAKSELAQFLFTFILDHSDSMSPLLTPLSMLFRRIFNQNDGEALDFVLSLKSSGCTNKVMIYFMLKNIRFAAVKRLDNLRQVFAEALADLDESRPYILEFIVAMFESYSSSVNTVIPYTIVEEALNSSYFETVFESFHEMNELYRISSLKILNVLSKCPPSSFQSLNSFELFFQRLMDWLILCYNQVYFTFPELSITSLICQNILVSFQNINPTTTIRWLDSIYSITLTCLRLDKTFDVTEMFFFFWQKKFRGQPEIVIHHQKCARKVLDKFLTRFIFSGELSLEIKQVMLERADPPIINFLPDFDVEDVELLLPRLSEALCNKTDVLSYAYSIFFIAALVRTRFSQSFRNLLELVVGKVSETPFINKNSSEDFFVLEKSFISLYRAIETRNSDQTRHMLVFIHKRFFLELLSGELNEYQSDELSKLTEYSEMSDKVLNIYRQDDELTEYIGESLLSTSDISSIRNFTIFLNGKEKLIRIIQSLSESGLSLKLLLISEFSLREPKGHTCLDVISECVAPLISRIVNKDELEAALRMTSLFLIVERPFKRELFDKDAIKCIQLATSVLKSVKRIEKVEASTKELINRLVLDVIEFRYYNMGVCKVYNDTELISILKDLLKEEGAVPQQLRELIEYLNTVGPI